MLRSASNNQSKIPSLYFVNYIQPLFGFLNGRSREGNSELFRKNQEKKGENNRQRATGDYKI